MRNGTALPKRRMAQVFLLAILCTSVYADYYFKTGEPNPNKVPQGGTIQSPPGTAQWSPDYMLGPESGWGTDLQGVAYWNLGCYKIYFFAPYMLNFQDWDERWLKDGCIDKWDMDVEDNPRPATGLLWIDTSGKGTFDEPLYHEPFYNRGSVSSRSEQVTIQLWIQDAGIFSPGDSDDGDYLASGSTNTITLTIYDSHLTMDIGNKTSLTAHEGSASCGMAASNAYNGELTGAGPSHPSWTDDPASGTAIYTEGGSVNTTNIDRHDCVTFRARITTPPFTSYWVHIATCTARQSEVMWQKNGCPDHTKFDDQTTISEYISKRASGCSQGPHEKPIVTEVRLFNFPFN